MNRERFAESWWGRPGMQFAVPLLAWVCFRPLQFFFDLRPPLWANVLVMVVGGVMLLVPFFVKRHYDMADYRDALVEARRSNRGSILKGALIDPLTTPVGAEWDDSRNFGWGLLRADSQGLTLTRSTGQVLLEAPWASIMIVPGDRIEIFVSSPSEAPTEWMVKLLDDHFAVMLPRRASARVVRRMQNLATE